ncbi:MAG: disulfide oxidoreductase [Alphaproteobacteria bacterium]|nr:disulfide oxidoreductase [Alphaproteobacteria bacterium]
MHAGESRASGEGRVTAVLGPTNTGKTHLAIERMLGHRSGMIGFPLRLLARENYDRIARAKGAGSVALITGEERILPPAPRWFVCTVEAMPLDRAVDFLAIDEIQMCADRERGHVFTDRLLHARGASETMFLGAETIRPIVRRLVPEAEHVARPRFSTLSYIGPRKITRLPRRSAIVAFSAAEVYGIAELVRRQRGGAAVVFGALSPRTRNAQVAMYQQGDVDHIVATDAIGMGLNMDIDHVAFAQLVKFDGLAPRRLQAPELAQIAGRAGRHMNDGTFGTTAEIGPLDPETIEAIEGHRFPPLRFVHWRNSDLDFRSPERLLRSLERRSVEPELIRVREALDHLTLTALMRDRDVMALAGGPARVRLLWDVCQIPDFRKTLSDAHVYLVGQIFRHLSGPEERLPHDWVARHVARLDTVDGDIDALLQRIAHIRTWTYVAQRPNWLADPAHWQERTRAIEDRLSDALHERLTQRFVDRRAAVLARRLRDGEAPIAHVADDGEVLVEGESAGRLDGFNFTPAADLVKEGAKSLLTAANSALRRDLGERLRRLLADDDAAFALDGQGAIRWRGQRVARLQPGEHVLTPRILVLPSDLLEAPQRERVRLRLEAWLARHLVAGLGPLWRLHQAELAGPARGIAYELVESLGVCRRPRLADRVDALDAKARGQLQALGVTFGTALVFLPGLRRCDPGLRRLLLCLHRGFPVAATAVPSAGWPPTLPRDPAMVQGIAEAGFYVPIGALMIRADRFEAFARRAEGLAGNGPFALPVDLAASISVAPADAASLLRAMGYRKTPGPEGDRYVKPTPRPRRERRDRREAAKAASPFAGLRDLVRR